MTGGKRMPLLHNVPIRRRFTMITMLITGVALLLTAGAFMSYDRNQARSAMVEDLSTTAQSLGDNTAAALSFNEPGAAEQTLKSLHADRAVVGAAIYARDGHMFATYHASDNQKHVRFVPPAFMTGDTRGKQLPAYLARLADHLCAEQQATVNELELLRGNINHIKDRIKVTVGDNGVGIAPDNLARIFRHGFTTRKDGHGFGLHSGALAAKETGGSLTVQSDDTGCGAAFILELPLESLSVAA